ncbi:MAG: hypothetical protein J6K04_12050 [Lachnospiraceae bacterium]|nr:hypothetical protein [Lachnospiraceae bacterium]
MFEKWKRKKESLPQVHIITQWEKKEGEFYAPGALVRVQKGKNLLTEKFSGEPAENTYNTLMFRECPLIQFQGTEYYCPTCEKIVRSGYQLEQTEEFHNEQLNRENNIFSDALEGIKPLLGLLRDNYYVVLDTELYPTDGNGHLFWNVPDNATQMPGSCLVYMGEGKWGYLRPHFTVATQSIKKLSKSRVEYYRKHQNCRAVAYYMDGYMTALIDGHHKAMSAALEHKMVKALVIMPCQIMSIRQENGTFQKYLWAGEFKFSAAMYGLEEVPSFIKEKSSPEEVVHIRGMISNIEGEFPYDNEELVSCYPSVEEVAYIDEAGKITEEYLEQILSERHICNMEEIDVLMKALGGLRHERLFQLADFFLNKCTYTAVAGYHNMDIIFTIVQQILKLPRTEQMEEYLIEIMVKYEDEYPIVKAEILEYL